MPKFNPDNLNIHELAIEEPEKKEPQNKYFDVERDVLPHQDIIRESLKRHTVDERVNIAATEMLIGLHPSFVPKNDMVEIMRILRSNKTFTKLAALNIDQKILGVKSELNWSDMAEIKNTRRNTDSLSLFVWTAACEAILRIDHEFDANDQKILEKAINRFRENKQWDELAYGLSFGRILGRSPDLSEQEMENIKEERESLFQERKIFSFMRIARAEAIIYADEVRIPEGGGLELINHKKENLQTEVPQIPEQKQF